MLDLKNFRIGVFGTPNLKKLLLKSRSFIGTLNLIEIFEYGKLDRYMIDAKNENGKYVPVITLH